MKFANLAGKLALFIAPFYSLIAKRKVTGLSGKSSAYIELNFETHRIKPERIRFNFYNTSSMEEKTF